MLWHCSADYVDAHTCARSPYAAVNKVICLSNESALSDCNTSAYPGFGKQSAQEQGGQQEAVSMDDELPLATQEHTTADDNVPSDSRHSGGANLLPLGDDDQSTASHPTNSEAPQDQGYSQQQQQQPPSIAAGKQSSW
eukprot:GHVU01123102.1.p1 GENE.GHVU01123102.1~~GHVU01123102.1.p1  ORF type:complete len:138 (-),score=16.09 GHVU01123102.1:36-449(-)